MSEEMMREDGDLLRILSDLKRIEAADAEQSKLMREASLIVHEMRTAFDALEAALTKRDFHNV